MRNKPGNALLLAVGIAIGLSSVTAPLYISEAAPRNTRGALVSLYQFAITIGILLAVVRIPVSLSVPAASMTGLVLQRGSTLLLLIYAAAMLSEGTFNPFIYFQF